MALTQRHHWVVAKIVSAFEPDIDNIKVRAGAARKNPRAPRPPPPRPPVAAARRGSGGAT